ncbi:hypothetical protein Bsp3421_003704 [Burkholderia sp. FERM BP-3421]|uniref:hypothetical protein n=1 Tax=Burkholderia sp. FERM BP-3421 TaxID=1494466 RepID=UPI00235E0DA8|nr:hypothetical protein [Burkholderia sp. FERM BP-3421]WDD93613.1 hypothetical protein Bsp3421_003704 [Burkholderia sp. FERM BP-3421]
MRSAFGGLLWQAGVHLMIAAAVLYRHGIDRQVRIVKALRDAGFGWRCFVPVDPDCDRLPHPSAGNDRRLPALVTHVESRVREIPSIEVSTHVAGWCASVFDSRLIY